jgi:hypothetical protein
MFVASVDSSPEGSVTAEGASSKIAAWSGAGAQARTAMPNAASARFRPCRTRIAGR